MTVPAEPLGPESSDDLPSVDVDGQRLARFFADLMLTLAEGGVDGTEAVEAVAALLHGMQDGLAARLDAETLVHGLGAVAAALAGQLVHERRAAGRSDATAAEVWQVVAHALDDLGSDAG